MVGFSSAGDGPSHAFLWRRGVMTDLGVLPGGDNSYAMAINSRGEIVGWSATAPNNGGLRAVRWHNGVMSVFDTPSIFSIASDINNRGEIVGDASVPGEGINRYAVRWRDDASVELLLPGLPSSATAVNRRGEITGNVFGGLTHGFLWQDGRFGEIDPPDGVGFLQPEGINDRTQSSAPRPSSPSFEKTATRSHFPTSCAAR